MQLTGHAIAAEVVGKGIPAIAHLLQLLTTLGDKLVFILGLVIHGQFNSTKY
jgi:hypothetical protein